MKPARLVVAALFAFSCCCAQSRIEDATIHSPGLEHNPLGDPADQPVSIYLPAAYFQHTDQRFPVVVFLHGYSDPTPRHQAASLLQGGLDHVMSSGKAQPMIVVFPNGINKYKGAFYANSSVDGNWDDYITRDVVAYVDTHYRTTHTTGIAGHSMGGYGALTLAFRHPETFSAVYAMSPCCTDMVADLGPENRAWTQVARLTSPDQVPQALAEGQFFVAAMSAMDAALAPDANAQTFGDAPFYRENGRVATNPAAYAVILSKMPVHMVGPFLANIQKLKGIRIEYGAADEFPHIPLGAQRLSTALSDAGVPNTLEVFEGDHVNRVLERFAFHMIPWMSEQLAPQPTQ